MLKFVSIGVLVALLIYLFSGLLPPKFAPHDHLLIGIVTSEQLRAHEEQEASTGPDAAGNGVLGDRTSSAAVLGAGGVIISITPAIAGSVSALHLEVGLALTLLLSLIPICFSVPRLPVFPLAISLPSPDPPPRRISALD